MYNWKRKFEWIGKKEGKKSYYSKFENRNSSKSFMGTGVGVVQNGGAHGGLGTTVLRRYFTKGTNFVNATRVDELNKSN